jgi:primosomal protein N''
MRKRKGKVGTRRNVAGWDVEEIEISEEKLKEKERKIKCRSAVRRIENF